MAKTFDRLAAKQSGYSDQEIDDYLSRVQGSGNSANTESYFPQQPQTPPSMSVAPAVSPYTPPVIQSPTQEAPQPGFVENIGGAITGLGKELAKPVVNTGKLILGAGYEGARAIDSALGNKDAYNYQNQNPFIPEEEFSDPEKSLRKYIGSGVQLASYGVPFGQGAGVVSKALIPGAVSGATFEAGREAANNEELNANKIIGSGAVGSLTAGAAYGAGKLYNKIAGSGESLQQTSSAVDQGTRQIKSKPSVYGSSKEKAVNQTLDKLGIKGSAQQQYAQLEPKMAELGDDIANELAKNPKTVSYTQLRNDFMKNVNDVTLTGELTNKQAKQAFDSYIRDLSQATTKSGLGDDISTASLFPIKQKVSQLYGPIADKLERGAALTPKEKITKSLLTTLDDTIANLHPAVKEATLAQSNLYEAARSLAPARSNPPTFRVAGTSVPSAVTQKIRDIASGGLNVAGGALQALPPISPSTTALLGAQIPKISGSASVADQAPQPQSAQQQDNNGINQQNSQGNLDHTVSNTITPEGQNQAQYLTGHSPEENYQAFLKAKAAGNNGAAAELYKRFQDETAYQKTQPSNKPPAKLTGPQQILMANTTSALKALDVVENTVKKDPSMVVKGEIPGIGGRLAGASTYTTASKEIADVLGRMRTGAVITNDELKLYLDKLPKIGDRPQDVNYKLMQLRDIFSDLQGRIMNTSGMTDQYIPTGANFMPEIPSGGYATP